MIGGGGCPPQRRSREGGPVPVAERVTVGKPLCSRGSRAPDFPSVSRGSKLALRGRMTPGRRFVYVLRSLSAPTRCYTGITSDAKLRLEAHTSCAAPTPRPDDRGPWKSRLNSATRDEPSQCQELVLDRPGQCLEVGHELCVELNVPGYVQLWLMMHMESGPYRSARGDRHRLWRRPVVGHRRVRRLEHTRLPASRSPRVLRLVVRGSGGNGCKVLRVLRENHGTQLPGIRGDEQVVPEAARAEPGRQRRTAPKAPIESRRQFPRVVWPDAADETGEGAPRKPDP